MRRHHPTTVACLAAVALAVAACSPTATTTTTEAAADTTTTVEAAETTTTTTTVADTTTTTEAPDSTTTTVAYDSPPVDEAVGILADGAHEVVVDVLDRLSRGGEDHLPLTDATPVGGAARELLAMHEARDSAYRSVVELAGTSSGNGEGGRVLVAAGTSRIIPLGDGTYYVAGVYDAERNPYFPGDVAGFRFAVDGQTPVLLDMVVWEGGSTQESSVSTYQGLWLSERLFVGEDTADHVTVSGVAAPFDSVTVERFLYGGWERGVLLTAIELSPQVSAGSDDQLVAMRFNQVANGDVADDHRELTAGFADNGTDEPGPVNYATTALVPAGESGSMVMYATFPTTIYLRDGAMPLIAHSVDDPAGVDGYEQAFEVLYDLQSDLPLCRQVDVDIPDSDFTPDMCFSPSAMLGG